MRESKKYWRDKISQLIQFMVFVYMLLIAIAIYEHDSFEIYTNPSNAEEQHKNGMAISLMLMGLAVSISFPMMVSFIYNNFLMKDIDETVIEKKYAMAITIAISIIIFITCCSISLR